MNAMENNLNEQSLSEAYLARCLKRLKEWGAPLKDWHCVNLIDMQEDYDGGTSASFATCELCDCAKVRYVHVMDHPLYFEEVRVGCICASIMEGNFLAAKERERLMRNRHNRRKNYLKKQWTEIDRGVYARQFRLEYKGKELFIKITSRNLHWAFCDGRSVCRYKNRPIDNFYAAVYAAFDLADPVEDIL